MSCVKRKVAVFTGTRADYGLLYYALLALKHASEIELQLIVSGSHLSTEYGLTVQQIEQDGFAVDARVDMLLSADSAAASVKSMGLGLIGFADTLTRLQPDILLLLGDRFEALAMAQAALLMHVPIFHLHGGELTEGAYDDAIRHAISKFSQYHGTATEIYRQRVIQLGEAPERVFCVGAPGLEAIVKQPAWSRAQILDELDLPPDARFMLITYHAETQDVESSTHVCKDLMEAALRFAPLYLVCTYPNADEGGRFIIAQLDHFHQANPTRIRIFPSLGRQRYLAAVRHSELVLGNSSSGVIEVPSLKVPTVNVGLRQGGRLAADSVVHCGRGKDEIHSAIARALTMDCRQVANPYGDGDVSSKLLSLLKTVPLTCQKTFYDLPAVRNL